jgi:chemotaxis response regulator CheB
MGIRVLVASQFRLYREALGRVFERAKGQMLLVGAAESAADAVEQVQRLTPDITLLDMAMSDAFSVARNWGALPARAGLSRSAWRKMKPRY